MKAAGSFSPFPRAEVSLLKDLQGTNPRESGRLSSTCTPGNARLYGNINIFYVTRKIEGESKNLWEQRLERHLSGNSACPQAEEQAQNMRNNVPGYGGNVDL